MNTSQLTGESPGCELSLSPPREGRLLKGRDSTGTSRADFSLNTFIRIYVGCSFCGMGEAFCLAHGCRGCENSFLASCSFTSAGSRMPPHTPSRFNELLSQIYSHVDDLSRCDPHLLHVKRCAFVFSSLPTLRKFCACVRWYIF